MDCQAINSWTFSALVGAFLDLTIAYLLLWGSSFAFITSKFLGLFGLSLPCPCTGLFGNPNGNNCLQRVLVDCPTDKISSVHLSVKSKFPFDTIWAKDQHGYHLNLKLVKERNYGNGYVELEGEASCSSVSDARKPQDLVGRESVPRNESVGFEVTNSPALKEIRFDPKGKGAANQRPRLGLRRRRRGAIDGGKISSVASYDPLHSELRGVPRSSSSMNREGAEESLVPLSSSGTDGSKYGGEAPMGVDALKRVSHDFSSEPVEENKFTEKNASPGEEFSCKQPGFDGNKENAVRVLEQALEEEHAARAALYLELEKERTAAATAADEAMAMILRLQEEKGLIEMEARQYQRMNEEKSEYDAEEMNILKEILLRREREKHSLEKEVEAYRQMIFGHEQLDGNIAGSYGQRASSMLFSSEDPILMLQKVTESIGRKEELKNANNFSVDGVTSVESPNRTLAFGKELAIPEQVEDANFFKQMDIHRHASIDEHNPHLSRCNGDNNEEFQEKGMVFMENNPFDQQIEAQGMEACSQFNNSPQGFKLLEKTIRSTGKEQEQSDNSTLCIAMTQNTESHNENEINISYDGEDLEKHDKYGDQKKGDPSSSVHDAELCVHDVHVIDDKSNLCTDISENRSERMLVDTTLNVIAQCGLQRINSTSDCSTTSRIDTESDINGSSLDMPRGLPPMGTSRGKPLFSDMRRNSMSAVGLPPMGNSEGKALLFDLRRNSMSALDYERMKIDTEVELLRERLRIVQEGREKLNISVEHREREQIQLQLLEDIARQLREIRHLTAPGKAVRQASLPLPSKVMSKKRRCRSVSLGVRNST